MSHEASLYLADQIKSIDNKILDELDQLLRAYMVTMAVAHPVPGFDPDDLMQEMRLKMWERVRDGKYDPEKSKPITYFSWVFRTTLYTLRRDQNRHCRVDNLNFSDSLDEINADLEQESKHLAHHDLRVLCDKCLQMVDPHLEWISDDECIICAHCVQQYAREKEKQLVQAYT